MNQAGMALLTHCDQYHRISPHKNIISHAAMRKFLSHLLLAST